MKLPEEDVAKHTYISNERRVLLLLHKKGTRSRQGSMCHSGNCLLRHIIIVGVPVVSQLFRYLMHDGYCRLYRPEIKQGAESNPF